jgi:hypothetical protein
MSSIKIARSNADGGPVAQWSELAAHNRLVGGSSPPGPTIKLQRVSRLTRPPFSIHEIQNGNDYGNILQSWAEPLTSLVRDEGVAGSNPATPTSSTNKVLIALIFLPTLSI